MVGSDMEQKSAVSQRFRESTWLRQVTLEPVDSRVCPGHRRSRRSRQSADPCSGIKQGGRYVPPDETASAGYQYQIACHMSASTSFLCNHWTLGQGHYLL